MIRKAIIAVLTLGAAIAGLLIYTPSVFPCVIFTWGFKTIHVLEPLKEHYQEGLFSIFFGDKKTTNGNWDGTSLFVGGACFVCGKPYAPRGSFVIANLPRGIAYARHDGNEKYSHMSRLVYVRGWMLNCVPILLLFYPALTFYRGPLRLWRRRRKGLCIECGYDLKGNVSGICPECGTKVKG